MPHCHWPIFGWKRGRFLHCVSMIRWMKLTKNPHSDIEEWGSCVCLQCSFLFALLFRSALCQHEDFQVMSVIVQGSNSCPPGHSCWTQIRDRRGWMVFIYRVMAHVFEVLLWKWIHVLFCSHCLGSMGLFTDTKKCDYSGSRIGIWHKTWYNLDTQLFEKKNMQLVLYWFSWTLGWREKS